MGFDPYKDYLSKTGRQLLLMLPGLAIVLAVIGLGPIIGRWQAVLVGVAAAVLVAVLVVVSRRSSEQRRSRRQQ